jgi:hypothetical protein
LIVLERLPPKAPTPLMIAADIKAAMRPYSMTVAPVLSVKIRRTERISSKLPAWTTDESDARHGIRQAMLMHYQHFRFSSMRETLCLLFPYAFRTENRCALFLEMRYWQPVSAP